MTAHRWHYAVRPDLALGPAQQHALLRAWVGLACDAVELTVQGRGVLARDCAERARELVAAFGARIDELEAIGRQRAANDAAVAGMLALAQSSGVAL